MIGMLALTVIESPALALVLDAGNVVTKARFDAFINEGDTLPAPVNGLTSYIHILDEFHCCKYHCGLAVVPALIMTYRICSPPGPATEVTGIVAELTGTPVTLNS